MKANQTGCQRATCCDSRDRPSFRERHLPRDFRIILRAGVCEARQRRGERPEPTRG